MTRRLPWKRASGQIPSPTPASSRRHIKEEAKDSDVDIKASPAPTAPSKPKPKIPGRPSKLMPTHQMRNADFQERAGSTSPPPEPLQESYMVEGADKDDRWRMVEDEFLATAQRFTAHLHAAEYQRLKAVAKSQNADAIKTFARPVVGTMTDSVKMKHERIALQKKQKRSLKRAAEETDSDDENKGMPTSLYGLMESPRKQAPRLDGIAPISASTRAAAGFVTSQAGGSQPLPASQPTSGIPPANNKRRTTPTHEFDDNSDDSDDLEAPSRPFIDRLRAIDNGEILKPVEPLYKDQGRLISQKTSRTGQVNGAPEDAAQKATVESGSHVPPASRPRDQHETSRPQTETKKHDNEPPESSNDSDLDGDLFSFKNRRAKRRSLDRRKSGGKASGNSISTNNFIPTF